MSTMNRHSTANGQFAMLPACCLGFLRLSTGCNFKGPETLSLRAFKLVAGEGFEPTTLGL